MDEVPDRFRKNAGLAARNTARDERIDNDGNDDVPKNEELIEEKKC
jgi:hypothetical protein